MGANMKISGKKNEGGVTNKIKNAALSRSEKIKKPSEKSGKGKKALIVVIIVAVVLVTAFFLMGAYANGMDTIYANVSMENIDLGGLTAEEAANALAASSLGSEEDKQLVVTLPAGVELTVSAQQAGCYMSAPDAAAYVYDLCHGGSFFSNTITYFRSLFGGLSLTTGSGAQLDEEYLKKIVDEAVKQAEIALMDNSIEIGEDTVSIVKGASAATVDGDELYDKVKESLVSGNFEPFTFEAKSNGDAVEEVDLQAIYDMVFQEPKNAEYDAETGKAAEHVTGRSFDMDEAQRLWDAAATGEMVIIPLILEEPEITTDDLDAMLFADVLAQKSTTLTGSSAARINNITKAAASINGIILNPGEEFSYNETVGQRTASAGYQGAGAYSGGKVVTEIGGGICQVSSTLYYCA
ncbi:MAG: hypothetical protein EOM14_09585, partial [Clostridia bacterium]|nr:hypothetical protein [Clostridia bacterium]